MKQPIRRFVFNRLALILTVMILLLTVISAGYLYKINEKFYLSKYQEQTYNYEWALAEWLRAGHQELDYMEGNFFPMVNHPLSDQHILLKRLYETKPNRFDYIFMADPSGQYITSKSLQSKSIADRIYFQHAIKGENYTSEMIISRLTNNRMMVLSGPLYSDTNRLIGTFSGAIEVSNMSKQLKQFGILDPYTSVYIVDRLGQIGAVVSSKETTEAEKFIGTDIQTVLPEVDLLGRTSGHTDSDHGEVFYREIKGSNGWRVIFVVAGAAKYEGFAVQLLLIAAISGLLLFFVYLFSNRFSAVLVSPIHDLIYSFEALANGTKASERPDFKIEEIDQLFTGYEKMSDQLYQLTYHDTLTDLYNLTYFRRYLQKRLDENQDQLVQSVLLVFIEIDHFKMINDTFGFSGGDAVLRHIAAWLKENPEIGHASKMNGDEFAFLVEDELGILKVYELFAKLNGNLREGIPYMDSKIIVSVSAGISHFYDEQRSAELYFQNAYIALNEAKKEGVGAKQVFNQRLKSNVTRRVMLEMIMRSALENGEMYPVYQPIIGLDGIQISGFEALIRWESPKMGFVSPNEFIPIAENSRFIIQIGKWMIDRTLSDLKALKAIYGDQIYMSLNASSIEFETDGFAKYIMDATLRHGHLPKDIVIELTERVMMNDQPVVDFNIKALIENHFQLSLDDFGTGYSSLSYLLKYPFSVVKIDRAFVANHHSRSAHELLEVMRLIAEKYQLKTVAEGVETEEQANRMSQIGFSYGQGYYYGRPKKLEDL